MLFLIFPLCRLRNIDFASLNYQASFSLRLSGPGWDEAGEEVGLARYSDGTNCCGMRSGRTFDKVSNNTTIKDSGFNFEIATRSLVSIHNLGNTFHLESSQLIQTTDHPKLTPVLPLRSADYPIPTKPNLHPASHLHPSSTTLQPAPIHDAHTPPISYVHTSNLTLSDGSDMSALEPQNLERDTISQLPPVHPSTFVGGGQGGKIELWDMVGCLNDRSRGGGLEDQDAQPSGSSCRACVEVRV
ncbi:hypothetical protein JAAARDRAFT_198464 [Jaapia argillacea MUCL 33604]|uniref:Uncharacterized protein n=1 Tax=Jaapia argillacea MUCL 33604 TaxID=933084 RepID=A0A067PBJ2_9AGAM|nr:hypothetical protein JAAARDRAFT_198464 [Jaapia argillacea MUCL 33604]